MAMKKGWFRISDECIIRIEKQDKIKKYPKLIEFVKDGVSEWASYETEEQCNQIWEELISYE